MGSFGAEDRDSQHQPGDGRNQRRQKATADFNAKFQPAREKLAKQQADLDADKAKLSQGSNTMSAEQREKLLLEIDRKTKLLNRDNEDANAEFEQEQNKVTQELWRKIRPVVDIYAKDHGYSLVLDVSSQ